MTNYSRTTLRELKKRYLNILKKCLLANLLAFSFMLPAGAEESLLDKLMTEDAIKIPTGQKAVVNFEFDKSIVVTNSGQSNETKIRGGGSSEWGETINFSGKGKLTFDNIIVTHNNTEGAEIKFSGSSINSYATVNFNTHTVFSNNKINVISNGGWTEITGGAILLMYSPVTFKEKAEFSNNKITAKNTNGTTLRTYGGAISTSYSSMDFKKDVEFKDNSSESIGSNTAVLTYAGAIYNAYNEVITINGSANFLNNKTYSKSDLKGGNTYGGAIYNGAGTVNFLGEANFKGNKGIIELEVNGGYAAGGALYNGTYNFSKVANFIGNETYGTLKKETGSNIGISGGAVYNGIITFSSNVNFIDNKSTAIVEKAWVSATGSALFAGKTTIEGSSNFKGNEAVSKSISGGGWSKGGAIQGGTHIFNGVASFIGNKSISTSESGYMRAMGGAISEAVVNFNNSALFIENITEAHTGENKLGSMGGAIYNDKPIEFNGKTMFMDNTAIGSTLGEIIVEGGAIYNAAAGVVNLNSDFDFSGNKTIKNGVERKNDIYNEGTIKITGDKETVGVLSGGINGVQVVTQTETETTTKIPQINKSGTGLLVLGDNSENHEYEGTFTQTAGVTIANSEAFFSHELAQTTINGGELKTHGAEIAYKAVVGQNVDDTGAVLSAGKVMHYTTKPEMEVNAETLANITFAGEDMGATIGVGTYNKAEQEKEIALVGKRLVEYIDDKGTEDTSDDEVVSYQATDKLFTIDTLASGERTKFKVTGALPNEKGNTIAFVNGIVEIGDIQTLADYEFNSSTLKTPRDFEFKGKVTVNNLELSDGLGNLKMKELKVVKDSDLDIKNTNITTDLFTLDGENNVKVSVHSLSDYGQILAKETVSKGSGTLTMNLVGAPQEGVYKVFEQDTDLKLATTHEFFDISDLENGSYKIARKKADELADKFGLNEEETRAVSAVIGGNSENKAFQKVQTEIMETLKSGNKGKAKKALSAVGSKEHPVEQSVASEHLVALQNVVQAELHGSTVGHSGGDMDPRAKVYIKGLYDRTKSSMGEGFRARSKGAVLGVQSEVTEALTLGVGYATSQTTAKEDLRRMEVDTNTGFISAHYQPNAWWVSGLATFSRGEYEEEKQILSSMGKASYNVDSWGAQVMTGYDIKLETAIITPEVGLRYLSVKQEGYTDTLGTTVSGTQSDYLTALVGVKGTWNMGAIRPTAGVTVGYDIISDDVSALNTLANGASYTVNGEALDRLSTTLTTGIEADLGDRTTLKLEYSGTYRKEYVDHSGMLKLEMRF